MIIESLRDLAVPIDSLQVLPGNPRVGDVEAVAASLDRFGQRKPIVVRKDDGTIIAGNHTWQAAKQLGWSEIAVAYVGDDDVTAQAYALADNRTAELGGYDEQALKDLIDKVAAVDPELVRISGWSDDAVQELIDKIEAAQPKAFKEDVIPELPTVAKTKLGDIYQLGRHRLMCGDSTDEATVLSLMDGAKADMIFTDPPYGIDYSGRRGQDKIANDKNIEVAHDVFSKVMSICKKIEIMFVCCDWRSISFVIETLEKNGIRPTASIVWDKGRPVSAFQKFGKMHELIIYSGSNKGPLIAPDVWRVERDFEPDHPTPKPIELIKKALETSSQINEIIFDPFAGSGSTLIACEDTKRNCYTIELEPKYCDVILTRWENLTGEKAVLLNAEPA